MTIDDRGNVVGAMRSSTPAPDYACCVARKASASRG
jgi:hypothetical protein